MCSSDLVLLPELSSAASEPPPPQGPPPPRRAVADYYEAARTPIASLLFVLPFLAIYEVGVRLGGPSALVTRNPADTWMRLRLLEAGYTRPWMLPTLVVGTLLAWELVRHVRADSQAHLNGRLWVGMLTESVVTAWVLVLLGQACGMAMKISGLMSLSGSAAGPAEWAAACVGAGLYEETLFRLWGLPAIYLAMRAFLVPRKVSAVIAVITSSLLFAAAHYVHADLKISAELLFGFGFRCLAGGVFAGLLMYRGFGVAVGAHVIYDATVLLLMAA